MRGLLEFVIDIPAGICFLVGAVLGLGWLALRLCGLAFANGFSKANGIELNY